LVFGDDDGVVAIFGGLVFVLADRLVGGQDILLRPGTFGAFACRMVIAQPPFMAPQSFAQMRRGNIEGGIGIVGGFMRPHVNVTPDMNGHVGAHRKPFARQHDRGIDRLAEIFLDRGVQRFGDMGA
jgi:hypothetical protein